jgi:hypothetical protein
MDSGSRGIRKEADTFNVVWVKKVGEERKECNLQSAVPRESRSTVDEGGGKQTTLGGHERVF